MIRGDGGGRVAILFCCLVPMAQLQNWRRESTFGSPGFACLCINYAAAASLSSLVLPKYSLLSTISPSTVARPLGVGATVVNQKDRISPEERLRVLKELMRVAASSLDVGETFDEVGEQIKQLIDYDRLSFGFLRPGDDHLEVYAVTGSNLKRRVRLPLNSSSVGEAVLTRRPILLSDFPDDSPYEVSRQVSEELGVHSAIFVPLETKGRVIGVLLLFAFQRGQFNSDDLESAKEIGSYLAVIAEHTLLYEESKETAKLQERNRLAREIHDTLAQGLTGIIWHLNTIERTVQSGGEQASESIKQVRDLTRDCLQEVRRSVWNLQSPEETISLEEALQGELRRTTEQGFRASIEVEGEEPDEIDRECHLTVLRIAQEALSNVRHHSQAKRVTVDLSYEADAVRLLVSDDGIGFEPSVRSSVPSLTGGGFGMTSMRERVKLMGGQIEVRSAPDMGTKVEIEVPYQQRREQVSNQEWASLDIDVSQSDLLTDGIRVLLVDDHEVIRQGIRSMLEQSDEVSVVGEADDGETAIEQIVAIHPNVVLMDIQMPKLDGVETVRRLRQLGIDTPVVLLSVYAKDEYIFDGLRAGARGYLMKDVGRAELVQAIKTVHAGGSLLQPVIANRLVERMAIDQAAGLSERQQEVLQLLASGVRNQEIADQLFLSLRTVKFHIENLYRNLGVRTRTEAVRVARERSILPG